MERVNSSNAYPRIENLLVSRPFPTVDQILDENLSPLTYHERAREFLPREEESNSLAHYFVGPKDTTHHSKLPYFFRLHGSIMPHLILPMVFVAIWAVGIWSVSRWTSRQRMWMIFSPARPFLMLTDYGTTVRFDSVLLTATGFLVGLALTFRSTTAYERYIEGRKYWAQMTVSCQSMARIIWVHAKEREGEQGKEDLLAKITCLQLIVTFAVALKHKLRFEPYIEYEDMRNYVEYLDTFAKDANHGVDTTPRKYSIWKRVGSFLGVSFAESDPRKDVKRASKPLGNLPLEILTHIESYLNAVVDNGTLKTPVFSAPVVNGITTLNDILVGTERILNTPLPLAYRIVITQITWIYVLSLPFQLYKMEWKMIPVTFVASYIILGLELIGTQIENPFGDHVNDLSLDVFCDQIAHDIDVISAIPAPKPGEYAKSGLNKPLWPLSRSGYGVWLRRSEDQIREALKMKVKIRHDSYKMRNDKVYEKQEPES